MISRMNLSGSWIVMPLQILLSGAVAFGLSACDQASGGASSKVATAPVSALAKLPNPGKWSASETIDPMTDSKIARVWLRADDANVTLVIACTKTSGWVHAQWGDFLGGEKINNHEKPGEHFELKKVTYRIGEGKPVTQDAVVLNDRSTTQFTDDVAFVEEVRASNRLVLQTQPHNKTPRTAVFDTTGLTEALTLKRPECDWYVDDIVKAEFWEKRRLADEEAKQNPPPRVEPSVWPQPALTEDALTK